jgi:hypothetical protein
MTKLIYGVGFNDRKYSTKENGKTIKSYRLWYAMLDRCYNPKREDLNPTYIGCTVSENFKSYSYFHSWAPLQIGFNLKDWDLDKDIILKGNQIYSEKTCTFVPRAINCFFNSSKNVRGKHPLGVIFNEKRKLFEVFCSNQNHLKRLGAFKTTQEAYQVYKEYKEQLCKDLANQWKLQIDPRVYEAMMVWTVEPF